MEFVFGENKEVQDINKVPEQFRGLYAQADGKYVLQEGYLGVVGAVDGLNKSLKAARRDADDYRKKAPDATKFAEIGQLLGLEGDDATSAEALRTAIEKTLSESKDGKVNWDKMKRDLEGGFNTKLTAKDGELKVMTTSLNKYLVNSQAVAAIAGHKGVPELLLPHIQGKTKVIKEGEEYVVRVVDEAGDPRGNASGGFMSIEDLVKEMKASPVFGRAFESEATTGGGMRPGAGGQRTTQQKPEMSPTDRIKAGLAKRNR